MNATESQHEELSAIYLYPPITKKQANTLWRAVFERVPADNDERETLLTLLSHFELLVTISHQDESGVWVNNASRPKWLRDLAR
jgi:hypothetical protein